MSLQPRSQHELPTQLSEMPWLNRQPLPPHLLQIRHHAHRPPQRPMHHILSFLFLGSTVAGLTGHAKGAVEVEGGVGVDWERAVEDFVLVGVDDFGSAVADDDNWRKERENRVAVSC
jgi:hypothetical protein